MCILCALLDGFVLVTWPSTGALHFVLFIGCSVFRSYLVTFFLFSPPMRRNGVQMRNNGLTRVRLKAVCDVMNVALLLLNQSKNPIAVRHAS